VSVTTAARLSRLLAMVPWLYANDGITIAEAARHFGVTERQLELDLWLLIVCGLPGYGPDQLIDIQFWGADARIHVLDPQALERPLRLSGEESAALLIALRLLAQVPGGHDRQALVSAMGKLQQVAGWRQPTDAAVVVDAGTGTEIVSAIDAAVAEQRSLRIRYAGSTRDAITDREVEPIGVTSTDGRAYLEGWCRLAGAVRTFRVDRILQASLGDRLPERPATRDPIETRDPVESNGSVDSHGSDDSISPATFASIRLAPRSRWALDVYPIEEPDEQADGSVVGWIAVQDPEWVVRLVLSMRGDLVVIGPDSLREAVVAATDRALRAYA